MPQPATSDPATLELEPQQSQEHTPLQLSLIPRLARKASHRQMGGTRSPAKAPPLTPVRVEPLRWSVASSALNFLSNIDRLEINDTVTRDGVTYFVLEVYQFHFDSRLPTNLNNPRRAASVTQRLSDASSASREPDFRVERRYSDFARLRAQVRAWACPSSQFTCQYCYEFGRYMRFKLRQPGLYMKLTTKTEQRKDILVDFMTDFIELAQCPAKNTIHRCEAHQHVPSLLESFVRD